MDTINTLCLGKLGIPYAEQYVGVWSILEGHANALLQQAKQINIQLHLDSAGQPDMQAAIQAQSSTDLHINRDGIAIIELQGSLMKHASSMSNSRSMVAARRQVRAAANDQDVKGILLHIDSPGGTVAGTVDLADDVAAAAKKKPVHAYVDDLCASAAYWIASQCTKIYTNRSAEVGSIGVFMAVTDWSALAEKEGAKVHVVKFGAFKGAGIPGTEVTEAHLAEWQKSVDKVGKMFVDAVASGRGISVSSVKLIADGRMHGADEAKELKLIDGIQSLDATLAGLAAGKQLNPSRRNAMSQEIETVAADKPASMPQLKKAFPKASSDFLVSQLEAEATMSEAYEAYAEHLEAENAKLAEEKEAAEKRATEAEKKPGQAAPAPKVRGNKLGATKSGEAAEQVEGDTDTDYPAMARALQAEKKISYRQACLAVKRQYPEAREAFKGKSLEV